MPNQRNGHSLTRYRSLGELTGPSNVGRNFRSPYYGMTQELADPANQAAPGPRAQGTQATARTHASDTLRLNADFQVEELSSMPRRRNTKSLCTQKLKPNMIVSAENFAITTWNPNVRTKYSMSA